MLCLLLVRFCVSLLRLFVIGKKKDSQSSSIVRTIFSCKVCNVKNCEMLCVGEKREFMFFFLIIESYNSERLRILFL